MLFRSSKYGFLGGYTVGSQSAVVKVPSEASYCRITILLKQIPGSDDPPYVDRDMLSFKLYRRSMPDQYGAAMQVSLKDASGASILTGGSYQVVLSISDRAVSDSDDLPSLNYAQLDEQTTDVTTDDMVAGKLDILSIIEFANLNKNRGFKAELRIQPAGWDGVTVLLDTVYFTDRQSVA